MTPRMEYQELSGLCELHIPGGASVDVLYFISFLAPLDPPSTTPMDTGHAYTIAHGHMTLTRKSDELLNLSDDYVLMIAGNHQISLRLTDNSMGHLDLYTFECPTNGLAQIVKATQQETDQDSS